MDPSDAANIVIIVVLILLSAFFSSAETALTTVSKLRMRSLAEEKNKNAATVLKLIEDPHKMLSTILVCNNVVNLSASSITTSYAFTICKRVGLGENVSLGAGIATGILTFLILIFGEISPKSIATKNSEKLSLGYAKYVLFLTKLLTPVVWFISGFANLFLKLLRVDMSDKATITEDELRTFVDVSHEEGVIESEERQMISNIFDFGDILAKDVMIPRMDMEMVSIDISYEDLMKAFTNNKFARMPVYEESFDNIVGIINMKDFVFFQGKPEDFKLQSLIREPHFTYEYKKTSELFLEMQRDFIPMTIVLDEYGALAGMITMEDILEEIVGEIRDEYDEDEEDDIQKLGDDEYIVLGSTSLDDIEEVLHLPIQSQDYDSIAGHVINLLSHFPEAGEYAEDKFATYTVLEVDKNRIDKLKMQIKPQEEETEEDEEKED
ncbi:MAG: HlyC/CorC family transporter [Lachnospiraceae bacterium]|nr:HlyC/CorC family transporter [Lachnospiraceae bacterium]